MRIKDDPLIIVDGRIEKETERAYLFLAEDADEAVWIPKSQVKDIFIGDPCSLTITEWIAKQKGFA